MKDVKFKGYDCMEFNIKVTMPKRWIPYFLSMLRYMEHLGSLGSSRMLAFYSDGDGDFRPKFESEIKIPEVLMDTKTGEINDLGTKPKVAIKVERVYDAG